MGKYNPTTTTCSIIFDKEEEDMWGETSEGLSWIFLVFDFRWAGTKFLVGWNRNLRARWWRSRSNNFHKFQHEG